MKFFEGRSDCPRGTTNERKATMNESTRLEFLKGTAWMGLAATAAGCRLGRTGVGDGAAKGGEGARLVFLGTSHGAVRPTRFCSCTMLQYGGRNYLIDAADGAAGRVRGTGIQFWDLSAVFITHPHSDHLGGVPQLLDQYMFSYRCYAGEAPKNKGELRVYFPGEDVLAQHRTLLNSPLTGGKYRMGDSEMLKAYAPGTFFDDGNIRVTAYGNDHMERRADGTQRAHSFLVELSNGRRIYFSGDLSGSYDLPLDPFKDGKKVDLLVSELVHYPIACAVNRLRGQPIGRIVFQHYGDDWEAGQPGRDERFEDFRRQLGIPAEIVTDLDVRFV